MSSCIRACAGSSEPVKMSEMGAGVACARRDGQRGKRKKWKVKEVSTKAPPPHPLQNRGLSDKKSRCFVRVPMRRLHLPHHRTYGGHFPRPVVASSFLFWSAVAASPERRAWTKCWIQRPASTHSPVTGQLFARGARPAAVLFDGAEAYVR